MLRVNTPAATVDMRQHAARLEDLEADITAIKLQGRVVWSPARSASHGGGGGGGGDSGSKLSCTQPMPIETHAATMPRATTADTATATATATTATVITAYSRDALDRTGCQRCNSKGKNVFNPSTRTFCPECDPTGTWIKCDDCTRRGATHVYYSTGRNLDLSDAGRSTAGCPVCLAE